MRLQHSLLLPTLLLLPLAPAPAAEIPSANELLARSIAYHDPQGRFLNRAHRLRLVEARPGGPDRHAEVLIDVPGERFEMKRRGEHEIGGVLAPGKCEMTLDGRADVTEEERKEHRLGCQRLGLMRNYYTYLWGLPMKLRDPGTRLGRVNTTTFGGRPVYDLRVTYDAGLGGDVWYFYFDQDNYSLVAYRFYHDEAKNDGEVIHLEEEVSALGMRLPQRRTWYTHQDGRLLGTDSLVEVVGVSP